MSTWRLLSLGFIGAMFAALFAVAANGRSAGVGAFVATMFLAAVTEGEPGDRQALVTGLFIGLVTIVMTGCAYDIPARDLCTEGAQKVSTVEVDAAWGVPRHCPANTRVRVSSKPYGKGRNLPKVWASLAYVPGPFSGSDTCVITIHPDTPDWMAGMSLAHEMGHCLGNAGHSSDPCDVMAAAVGLRCQWERLGLEPPKEAPETP